MVESYLFTDMYFEAKNTPGEHIYVYDKELKLYQVTPTMELIKVGSISENILKSEQSITFHPTDNKYSIVSKSKSLVVYNFNGEKLWEHSGNFQVISFVNKGNIIWAVERINKERLLISVYATANGQKLAYLVVHDELSESYISIRDIPYADAVLIELAAGQDGIVVIKFTYKNNVIFSRELFPGCSYILPAFIPDMTKIITLENDYQLYASFTWPNMVPITRQKLVDLEDESLIPGYDLIYLKNNLAITQNGYGEHFLFNTIKMMRLRKINFYIKEISSHQKSYIFTSQIKSLSRLGHLLAAYSTDALGKHVMLLIDESSITVTSKKII
ncbi:hypothetical protein NJB25_01730 [Escherichia fergusonii]|uniref:hypothetical protein n=2 Tax=Escherichia fergusonii TaxID=564 RepID=UPI001CC14FD7|nr:hypothetical protein [Escherichia fergusonii]MBZ4077985.1 hypothetical protein [Escherichia fergusonii]MBZ4109738.1 hypothetical protein [Escherichia fergusonii]MBZ4114163.1 hypothetical protein [Escherichia fergusonii]MBZ4122682.1 hypothetical protein [Escherichia fergusonii]MBZ4125749.1 hypothetical protein [Escherichia fergusonii]